MQNLEFHLLLKEMCGAVVSNLLTNLQMKFGFLEGCGEEKRKCHGQAKCVVRDGVEFCSCNIGFQGDGFSCEGKGIVRKNPVL